MAKKKIRYRLDIILLVSLFVLLVVFSAYMMNTSVFDVLEEERGAEIITHDNEYEYSTKD